MSTTHGFELIREETIHELNTVARRYRHVQSGADLLSLQNDDENKSFGIAFRTPPADSTGLPHIMEHSVLCGSRKYPLKEPFTELLKGSLKTTPLKLRSSSGPSISKCQPSWAKICGVMRGKKTASR